MDRRLFFRALVGSAPAAALAAPKKPEPTVAYHLCIPLCECGFQFMVRKAYTPADDWNGERGGLFGGGIVADNPTPTKEYMVCDNRKCRHYEVAFSIPTVQLERADAGLKKAVDLSLDEEARRYEELNRKRRLKAEMENAAIYPPPYYPGRVYELVEPPEYLVDPSGWRLRK
jgi:hypothetical protein